MQFLIPDSLNLSSKDYQDFSSYNNIVLFSFKIADLARPLIKLDTSDIVIVSASCRKKPYLSNLPSYVSDA